ncbi:MAG: hypothetical protein JAY99_02190 [Candidatus Thiodiazotropha lotti]|nr:hypothetical protein [Candidatus Thiodiazotropha lotti]MCG7998314.1 hypothetical protein [Candidatus Thiodiazotropha lotti]MCW4182943.1 hypothetical protein [Candidatus Thiodiazotropha weberae]MCW4190080.1 hypothetical protein [Candidatus Thiodiazotropha weberae]
MAEWLGFSQQALKSVINWYAGRQANPVICLFSWDSAAKAPFLHAVFEIKTIQFISLPTFSQGIETASIGATEG